MLHTWDLPPLGPSALCVVWYEGVRLTVLALTLVASVSRAGAATHLGPYDPAPHVLLNSLAPDQLEGVLSSRLARLEETVLEVYQSELHRHHAARDTIQRARRYVSSAYYHAPVPAPTLAPVPAPPPQHHLWHSYVYDTGVAGRGEVVVEGVEEVGRLSAPTTNLQVIPLHIQDLPAIYRDERGRGWVEEGGVLAPLRQNNNWTATNTGCTCGPGLSQGCACCWPGGCLCGRHLGFSGHTCVQCGTEHTKCPEAETGGVEVDAAVAFQYDLRRSGRHNLLVTARGDTLTFYTLEGGALKELRRERVVGVVTHLGHGMLITDHDGTSQASNYIVVFGAGRTLHCFHLVTLSAHSPTLTIGAAQEWEADGKAMKVFQSGGKVMVTVLRETHLDVYQLKEDMWMRQSIQRVQTIKAQVSSWVMFSSGFESYLALVSPSQVVLNILDGSLYQSFQVLPASIGLRSFEGLLALNLESCRDEVLLIAGQGKDLVACALDPASPTPRFRVVFKGALNESASSWPTAFAYMDAADGSTKMVVTRHGGVMVVRIRTRLRDVADPVYQETQMVNLVIENIKEVYEEQRAVMGAASERLSQSVTFNTVVKGDVTFTGTITVNKTLTTEDLEAVRLVFPGTVLAGGVTHQQYLQHISTPTSFIDLHPLLEKIANIESVLADAVPITGGSRTITGLKTIESFGLSMARVTADTVTIGKVLDTTGTVFPLDATLAAIVRRGYWLKVAGKKIYVRGLAVRELSVDMLDDIPVTDLVTTTGRQMIAGAVFVGTLVAQEVRVRDGGTVAGVDLSEVVLLDQPAVLGRLTTSFLEVKGNVEVESGIVSGVDINRMFSSALLLSGGNITSSINFVGGVTIGHLHSDVMMGINVRDLAESVVFRDEASIMFGKLTVEKSVVIEGNLHTRILNQREFPGNYPLKTDKLVAFKSRKNFVSVVVKEVRFGANAVINGIEPHKFLTKTTEQNVFGKITFAGGVDIEGHLNITSKILDGVNLDELFAERRGTSLPRDWNFNVIFAKPVWMPKIIYDGNLNNFSFSAIAEDLIYRNEDRVKITSKKLFHTGLAVTNAHFAGNFNGRFVDAFVTTDADQIISGLITFEQDLKFNHLLVSHINGVNLNELLHSALYRNKPGQVVSGRKIFTKDLFMGSLFVQGKASGVDFSNVVTTAGDQTFTSPQIFHSAQFSAMFVQRIIMSDGFTVNGIDLSEVAKLRMLLRKPTSHTATLTVEGPVTVTGTLFAEQINGQNIEELRNSLMTEKLNDIITGPVTLSSLTVEGSVSTAGSVGANGFSIAIIADAAVKLNYDNIIHGHLSFESVEVIGEVVVEGLVAGQHLRRLHQEAIYTDLHHLQTVPGNKIFEAGFSVRGDLNAGKTNGVDLSRRLLTLHTDQVVVAPYIFRNMRAKRTVLLQGLFNGINLKDLVQQLQSLDGETVVGNVRFLQGVVAKNLVVTGTVDGVNVAAILNDSVRLGGKGGVEVTGSKTFLGGIIFTSLHVEFLNNVHFDSFLANRRNLKAAPPLSGRVVVLGSVIAPWVTADVLHIQGMIDGVDYETLKAGVIYLSGDNDVSTELVFSEGVTVRGDLSAVYLNSRHLAQQYLTTTTDQVFTTPATFSTITASRIDVAGLVNSWYLPDEEARTMKRVGGQTVVGVTRVSGRVVVVGDLEVGGAVGRRLKVKLRDQAVLLSGDVVISSSLRFTSLLTVTSLSTSTGLVSGVDVVDLYKNTWFIDVATTIRATFIFGKVILKRGLLSQGPIDGLEVEKAYQEISTALALFQNSTKAFQEDFESVCGAITALYSRLEDNIYEADHLRLQQLVHLPAHRHSSLAFTAWGVTYLVVTYEDQCHSDVLVWQGKGGDFRLHQHLHHTGRPHHWLLLEGLDEVCSEEYFDKSQVFVAMAASSRGNDCTNTNSTIWQVTRTDLKVHQVLAAGESLSQEPLGSGPLLHLHTPGTTLTYQYTPDTRHWHLLAPTLSLDGGVWVERRGGEVVSFHHVGGTVEVREDGVRVALVELGSTFTVLHSAAILSPTGRPVLVIIVASDSCDEPSYSLKVYYWRGGALDCVGVESLETPGQLTVFWAGNTASGATFIIIPQGEHLCPAFYTLTGEVLRTWVGVSVSGVRWVQHMTVPSTRFPAHYLLMGRYGTTVATLYRLVMTGAALTQRNITCNSPMQSYIGY